MTAPPAVITAMTAASTGGLAGIDADWTPERLTATLARPAAAGLMAMTDGIAAGFIIGWCISGEAEIIQISVAPAYHRRGIGALLLQSFLESHAPAGCHLEVRADNRAAQALYRRFGFVPYSRRPGYYADMGGCMAGRTDAVLMRLDTPRHES